MLVKYLNVTYYVTFILIMSMKCQNVTHIRSIIFVNTFRASIHKYVHVNRSKNYSFQLMTYVDYIQRRLKIEFPITYVELHTGCEIFNTHTHTHTHTHIYSPSRIRSFRLIFLYHYVPEQPATINENSSRHQTGRRIKTY